MANLIKNGGDLTTTTDWTNVAYNGVAQYWTGINNGHYVVTGSPNGFVGNAQHSGPNTVGTWVGVVNFGFNKIYNSKNNYFRLSLKHRSSNGIMRKIFINDEFNETETLPDLSANTGNATTTDYIWQSQSNSISGIGLIAAGSISTGHWQEIDEVIFESSIGKITTKDPIADITSTTATGGGDVIYGGFSTDTFSAGNCWSTSENPTISDSHTSNDTTTLGEFTSDITGLSINTLYHVRAYVTNTYGTFYGEDITFTTTSTSIPLVKIEPITDITTTGATCGGDVTHTGGASVTARGICWSTSTFSPTISDTHTTNGTGLGEFVSYMTGLTANTTYFVRAYATNSVGTGYSTITRYFTTEPVSTPVLPKVVLLEIVGITADSAYGNAAVTSTGGASVTARGLCWDTSTAPTTADPHTTNGTGLGEFTGSMTGLTDNVLYYVRSYATNSQGTAYSNELTFTTLTPALTIPLQVYSSSSWHLSKGVQIYSGGVWNRPKAAWAYLLGEWRIIF